MEVNKEHSGEMIGSEAHPSENQPEVPEIVLRALRLKTLRSNSVVLSPLTLYIFLAFDVL